jgi:DNA mismatch repair protein MutL
MGKIKIMDEHLANQIAAGEVVERPASVVKELVENAIDAEATKIQVQIEEGGISLIQVSDNGIGMDREDAVTAFSRHATSKIKRERDLFSIQTLGFRGEALPSIASVARVTLTTAHDPSELATRVMIAGGEILEVEDTSRSRGTDVLVKDLFYNTPARLKYLKTVNTEVSHVADVVGRLAISHPSIAFSLTHNDRELFRTSGDGKLLHVLYALYGKQVASRFVPLAGENLDFRLQGYMSKPEVTRSTRSYLSIILNGRFVRSIPITQAVLRAYGTLLPSGRYPIGALHIEMDPKLVDVNVHPSKLEVRLSKERECCQLIEEAIKQAFGRERFVPQAEVPRQSKENKSIQDTLKWDAPAMAAKRAYPVSESGANTDRVKEQAREWPRLEPSPGQQEKEENSLRYHSALSSMAQETSKPVRWEPGPERKEKEADPIESVPETEAQTQPAESRLPHLLPLAQIHGTYIVAQAEDGFYLLDQHAAHERIYYEIYSKKLGEENHKQYPLLVPLTVECSPAEAEVLESRLDYLRKWGLEIEPFGGTTFVVRAYPTWFPSEQPVELVHEIIEWLKEHGEVDTAMLRDRAAKMMSCKAAIKANRHLRQDEMEELLRQLNLCDNPFTCPHGRPILIHFSTYELEKMFKRVM